MTYRGHIKNGVAVLDEPADLPEGAPVIIHAVESFEFGQNLSVSELTARQQPRPTADLDDLAGDWPPQESVDEFLSTVREARR